LVDSVRHADGLKCIVKNVDVGEAAFQEVGNGHGSSSDVHVEDVNVQRYGVQMAGNAYGSSPVATEHVRTRGTLASHTSATTTIPANLHNEAGATTSILVQSITSERLILTMSASTDYNDADQTIRSRVESSSKSNTST
jgi:hypothetical protein